MRIDALPHQAALWANEDLDSEVAMVGPLGCGKSFALAVKAAMLSAKNKGLDGMLVVPTYRMAKRVHLREWPPVLEQLGVIVRVNHSDSAFEWPWGGKTWIGSAEDPDSLAGPNLAYVLFDEPGLQSLEAWERAAGRARHPKATVRQKVLAGTPEGINWFADLFAVPQPPRTTIWARSWHPDMAHYPNQLAGLYAHDSSLLDTYLGGKFVPMRIGRAWRFFDPAIHEGECCADSVAELILACDFNVDAMRWLVGQRVGREFRWFDEIALGRDGSTEQAAREFVRRWGAHVPGVVVCGDASGKARSTAGRVDYRVLEEELRRGAFRRIRFDVPEANPRVKDRVDRTNYMLAGRGGWSVVVSPKCKELRLDWIRCSWKQGIPELDKSDPQRTHAADAVDYAHWSQSWGSLSMSDETGRPKRTEMLEGQNVMEARF